MPKAADVEWECRANHITSLWRAVGGRLSVADGELRFEPRDFDRALAAHDLRVPLSEIAEVGAAPRRPFSHVFGAGLRRQLCVESRGRKEYFVVNRVDRVVAELRGLAQSGAGFSRPPAA